MARMQIHPKVADALRRGSPVVAMESAVITTGLPREPLSRKPIGADDHWRDDQPVNLEAARLMRRLIDSVGAVPAVIAMIEGDVHIGLDDAQLTSLAADEDAGKVGTSTLAHAIVTNRTAGTTVSATIATMQMPPQLGEDLPPIRFFATGGIGGVHRGWTDRPDISNDLRQLACSPVCAISAGAKSVLDLPATVEVLEALGVPVVGFGTDTFPAFYTRGDETLAVPMRLDEPTQVAELCCHHWRYAASATGVLVANPIPQQAALDQFITTDELDSHIRAAEEEAASEAVTGAARTPFVLAELSRRTGGRVLDANIALLAANATLAANIAVAWTERARSAGR
jgi:pseudouridylate synthase